MAHHTLLQHGYMGEGFRRCMSSTLCIPNLVDANLKMAEFLTSKKIATLLHLPKKSRVHSLGFVANLKMADLYPAS